MAFKYTSFAGVTSITILEPSQELKVSYSDVVSVFLYFQGRGHISQSMSRPRLLPLPQGKRNKSQRLLHLDLLTLNGKLYDSIIIILIIKKYYGVLPGA